MEFFHKQTNFPFMATRKVWYTLSAILMIGSVVSFATRGLNLGIDFTGGISATASFAQAANVDAVRTKLTDAGFKEPQRGLGVGDFFVAAGQLHFVAQNTLGFASSFGSLS